MEKKYYVCTNCGFSITNRSTWCDLGCGSDYNRMIDVTKNIEKLVRSREAKVDIRTKEGKATCKCEY